MNNLAFRSGVDIAYFVVMIWSLELLVWQYTELSSLKFSTDVVLKEGLFCVYICLELWLW